MAGPYRNSEIGAHAEAAAVQYIDAAGFSASGTSVLDPFFERNTLVTGAGVTFNQTSGAINILSGTTANAEFFVRSVNQYTQSMRLRASVILSQRIVNNNFALLLADLIVDRTPYNIISSTVVEVNIPNHGFTLQMVGQSCLLGGITGAAGVPGRYAIASITDQNFVRFTVAGWPGTGSGTLTVFGRNYVRHLFNGTTATTMNWDVQRNGWATGDTAATINTSASPGTVIMSELTGREAWLADKLRATSTNPTVLVRAFRDENIPDPDVALYVFLWSFNGTTNPASTTTWTLGHVAVEEFPNQSIYVQGFRANGHVNPIPVTFPTAQAVTGTLAAVTALTGGGVAEDAAAGANPVVTGGVARTAAAPATFVAGDAVRHTMTTAGAQTVALGAPVVSAEVASAARTTSGNSGVISVPTGGAISGLIVVSAQSGTNPTLDITLEESYDNGTTWTPIWAADRFSAATGTRIIPAMAVMGLRRWVWTIAGTTPSFTFAINTNQISVAAPIHRNLIDRTIVPTTLNSATPSLYIEGCVALSLAVVLGAAATPPVYGIQLSADNVNWYDSGLSVTGVASTTQGGSVSGLSAKFARGYVRTAGATVTQTYVELRGVG